MGNMKVKIYRKIRHFYYKLVPFYIHKWVLIIKAKSIQYKYYKKNTPVGNSDIIYMADGRLKHGGLSDRLNGIIACYKSAIENRRNFKIYFRHPFNLEEYLIPNDYNWKIPSSNINYGYNSMPVLFPNDKRFCKKLQYQLSKKIRNHPSMQMHVYTNLNSLRDEEFQKIFNKLFKPSVRLQKILDEEQRRIGDNYVSATFRFQQLLNDFKEGNYSVLDKEDALNLIIKCKEKLFELHNKYPDQKILVTSDSITFLREVRVWDFIVTTRGNPVHMDFNNENNFEVHVKAFIDLFLLANAKVIHSIVCKPMFNSSFPRLASKINNRPFVLMLD